MRVCLILLLSPFVCSSQSSYSTQDLKEGKFKADSSFIYSLPFENKKKVFLVQGYESKIFSHKNERALDFKVRKRTKVCAARAGVVISARSNSEKGGLKKENLSDGNYVSIQHTDGSVAHYWHLELNGVLVNVGDTVKTG
jgi:murein DD-endopeptidase MepM/ murein hydrolase activator NlpD